ncbi:MAG: carboxylating nicotinate-nucleotide diphosphorylase [Chloroflexi bacterium]|nr:carboxylating nicotinate-nucleotide diphosphorylase [Chloroflexota bacterium]MCY3696743.1 carboxylating nicotinate-nucleotide diphosphorylase [Chloroflexota bacterium]
MTALNLNVVQRLVDASLAEDRADLDLTTGSLSKWIDWRQGGAQLTARAEGVICGLDFALAAFAALDPDVRFLPEVSDGDQVSAGQPIADVGGQLDPLLRAERTALNWLQRLSGTATLTARAVAAAGPRTKILDTRKTTPGLRVAERYAVRCGGGLNHRDSLAAGVLIKDNHIAAVRLAGGSLGDAVRSAIAHVGPASGVEVEVTNLEEAREALDAGATALLLDNFETDDLPAAVEAARVYHARTEASGGITIEQIPEIARAGVDFISLGALTHSAPSLDIALDINVD